MKDVHDAGMGPGDRLELEDALELALVGTSAGEAAAPDDLHRPELAAGAPREPDTAVTAAADLLEDLVVGNSRRRQVFRVGPVGRARQPEMEPRLDPVRVHSDPPDTPQTRRSQLRTITLSWFAQKSRPFERSLSIVRAARLTAADNRCRARYT